MIAPRVRRLLITSGTMLAVFAGIATAWKLVPDVGRLDESISDHLHQWAEASPASVRAMLGVTMLGTHPFLIGLSAAMVLLLLALKHWRLAAMWAVVQLIGLVLIERTKLEFGRPRPKYNGFYTTEDSLSFPSGHALGSMAGFGLIAYLLAISRLRPAVRRVGIACCVTLIALVGFSRMFLGVHYFTDVLGGYALGAAWLLFAIALTEDIRSHYRSSASRLGQ